MSAKNIDYGYPLEPPHRGGSYEYPQSMFLSRNKKHNVYPFKPQFYYIKVGFTLSSNYSTLSLHYITLPPNCTTFSPHVTWLYHATLSLKII